MSIMIATNECKQCGEKAYFSMGSTKWYQDFIRRGKRCPQLERWEKYLKSGKCYLCITGIKEPIYAGAVMAGWIEYGRKITRRKKTHRVIKRRK